MNTRTLLNILIVATLVLILGAVFTLLATVVSPEMGAKAATPLRGIIGNRAVAELESAVFRLQDMAVRQANNLGIFEVEAPWQVTDEQGGSALVLAKSALPPASTPTAAITPSPDRDLVRPTNKPTGTDVPAPAVTLALPSPTLSPTPLPSPTSWSLPDIMPYGYLEGEGIWQPYIYNPDGKVVGLRTFLQPDPERSHTIVAVVAFDLTQTRLHYVLGTEEPSLEGGPRGYGLIAAGDKQPGRLLATFNGGFLATHGSYGAMSEGIVALPPKAQAGTVAIYDEGYVRIGVWGRDVKATGNQVAWRQNGAIVVHEGQINERVYNGSITTWGGSLDGEIVTWRSGLGISSDNKVLYFLAGPSMSMPILAKSMVAVGIHNGILLDINPYWVHFAAIRVDGDTLVAEPLLAEGMAGQPDRYLRASQRDFFYLTTPQQ